MQQPQQAAMGAAQPVAMGAAQPVAMGAAQPGMTTAVVMPDNGKSVLVSYLLWFFLGMFGVHHLYMGRGVGIWILSVITLQGFFLWLLVDLFMIPGSTKIQRGGQMVIVA